MRTGAQAVRRGERAGESRLTVRLWSAALLGVVVAAGALAVGAVGPGALSELNARPIRSVRIGGDLAHVARADLERRVGAHLAADFFRVDVDAVAETARAMPWVAEVSVRRVWPDSLHIAVIEREAVARWGPGGLVATSGEVFDPGESDLPGLPLLDGPAGSAPLLLETWRRVSRIIGDGAGAMGGGPRALALSARGIWRVECMNGMRIVLGRDQLDELEELRAVFDRLLGARASEIAAVDLRYTNGFAVRWKSNGQASRETHG